MVQLLLLVLLLHQPLELVAEGVASYYTVESSGPTTASGEPMRNDAFTCALPDGEFGSYCLVVAENGKAVLCRVNDRGPYVKGRVIDLSEAAMRQLDKKAGTLRVRVYQVRGLDISELLS